MPEYATSDAIFIAHVEEVEDLGWAEVSARMDRWEIHGYAGDWQDDDYDLPEDWSWPVFPGVS